MVLVAFLTNDGVHSALLDHLPLALIPGIKPKVLSLVLLLNKRFNDIGVMHAGICGVVLLDEFCLLVGLDVVFVAIVVLAALLRSSGIDVLVAALVGLALPLLLGVAILCLPKVAAVTLLDLLVLITGVTLAGSLHESGINNLAFVEGQSQRVKMRPEPVKQQIERTGLAQLVTTYPHCLLVRNLSYHMDAKKLTETRAVDYLVLNLVVAQAIVTLKKYDFEHEYYIYRLAARRNLALLGQKHVFKNGAEHLEVHQGGKALQGIAHLGESIHRELLLKQALAHRLAVYCRFIHLYIRFAPQRYDFFSNYENNLLIINNLIYRTSLKAFRLMDNINMVMRAFPPARRRFRYL